ncbi:unnamed protein product [Rotaria sp. Silwood2]|nr:unnamed protein product [Rotaria sp. Silwood2]
MSNSNLLVNSISEPTRLFSNHSTSSYSLYSNYLRPSPSIQMNYQVYSSHILTPNTIAGNYVYSSSMKITPITPIVQYEPMSTSLGLFIQTKIAIEDESIHVEIIQSLSIYVIDGDSKGVSNDLFSSNNQDDIVQLHGYISDHDISLINLRYVCKWT